MSDETQSKQSWKSFFWIYAILAIAMILLKSVYPILESIIPLFLMVVLVHIVIVSMKRAETQIQKINLGITVIVGALLLFVNGSLPYIIGLVLLMLILRLVERKKLKAEKEAEVISTVEDDVYNEPEETGKEVTEEETTDKKDTEQEPKETTDEPVKEETEEEKKKKEKAADDPEVSVEDDSNVND